MIAEQTRVESLIEALIYTVVGFIINYVANIIVLRAYGYQVSMGTAFSISMIFTAISVARGYTIRRWAQKHLAALKAKLVALVMQKFNLK